MVDLTESLTVKIEKELSGQIKDQMTKEFEQKVKPDLEREIENRLKEQYEKEFQERVASHEAGLEQMKIMAQLKVANQKSSENSNDQTSQDLQSMLQTGEAMSPDQNARGSRLSLNSIEVDERDSTPQSNQDDQDQFYDDQFNTRMNENDNQIKSTTNPIFQNKQVRFE